MVMSSRPGVEGNLSGLLSSEPKFRVVNMFRGTVRTLRRLSISCTSIVVASVGVPRVGNLSLVGQVHRGSRGAGVVVLDNCDSFSFTRETVRLNIAECLAGPAGTERLVKVLRRVRGGVRGPQDRRGRRVGIAGLFIRGTVSCVSVGCSRGLALAGVSRRLYVAPGCLDRLFGGRANRGMSRCVVSCQLRGTYRFLGGPRLEVKRVSRGIKVGSIHCFDDVFGGGCGLAPARCEGGRWGVGGWWFSRKGMRGLAWGPWVLGGDEGLSR